MTRSKRSALASSRGSAAGVSKEGKDIPRWPSEPIYEDQHSSEWCKQAQGWYGSQSGGKRNKKARSQTARFKRAWLRTPNLSTTCRELGLSALWWSIARRIQRIAGVK